MRRIISLSLPEAFQSYKGDDNNLLTALNSLSRINIFVGANNSGKSRFMRMLSTQREYKGAIRDVNIRETNIQIQDTLEEISTIINTHNFGSIGQVNDNKIASLREMPTSLLLGDDVYSDLRSTFDEWAHISSVNTIGGGDFHIANSLLPSINDASKKALNALQKIPVYSLSDAPKKVYIPAIRGLRPLDEKHTDVYADRTNKDYFPNLLQGVTPDVFTGLSLYQRLIDLLLGSNIERKRISQYQDFISETLFEGRNVTLIPNPSNKVVTVKIGKEKEQPIHHLGDGIQSAIILSFLPYVTSNPTFFFIEEPESYLHPGLQRKVLEFFASREPHTFFLTTHSNHLLDVTVDIIETTVYTFHKYINHEDEDDEQSPTFTVELVDTNHSSSLELLGVRNSSVFLVNATIWVEGVTDRRYLRAMLHLYIEHLAHSGSSQSRVEEDVHFAFVEYGGSNITHWSFLDKEERPIAVDRLCGRAFLVIDGDGDSKQKRKADLKEKLKERCCILPCREVENLLPYEVIKRVVLEYEGAPETTLRDFEHSSYQNEYLGDYIENTILRGAKQRRGSYKADSGTIASKVDFCERAIPHLMELGFTALPSPTQVVIKDIYSFIVQQNSK